VKPFRDFTMAFLDVVERGPVDTIVALPRLVAQSKALRDRLFLGWEQEAATLSPVIAEEAGAPEGRPGARGGRPHAGVDAPDRLPRRVPAAARRRGPARGRRRPAQAGAAGV